MHGRVIAAGIFVWLTVLSLTPLAHTFGCEVGQETSRNSWQIY
jgi:hypothetical protein